MLDEITLYLRNLSFPGFNPPVVKDIHGSCDGLLLIISIEDEILVMNPTTGEIRKVPPPPLAVLFKDNQYPGVFRYRLGYDSVTDDYKIVIILLCYCIQNAYYFIKDTIFEVYSLKFGSWKRVESSLYNYIGFGSSAGAFVGGCLHRLYKRTIDDKVAVVAFDLVDGKAREVPLPSSILNNLEGFYIADLFRYKLGVLDSCLCMSYATEYGSEVWVMKEYSLSKSWTKFVVNQRYDMLVCPISNQQVVMRFHDDNHVLWNLKQGTSKYIVFNGFCGRSGYLHVRASIVESLVSPHGKL